MPVLKVDCLFSIIASSSRAHRTKILKTAKVNPMKMRDRNINSMTNSNEHSEGPVARAIEEQTAKIPSDAFLWAAGASIAASLILKLLDRPHEALFVGQWAPTILILGVYNKLVKQQGSAPESRLKRSVSHSGLDSQIETAQRPASSFGRQN